MRCLLDTNVCVAILNGKDPALRERVKSRSKGELAICSVVKAELIYGATKSEKRAQNEQRLRILFAELESYPFDDEAATQYGVLRTALERIGTTVGGNDLMIASIALTHRLTLITRNEREFAMVPFLQIEAW